MLLLGDILRRNAIVRPNKLAVIFEEIKLSYKELNDNVNQFANALLKIGVKKGDRVGILVKNSHHFVIVFFATIKIGAILVPINFWYKGSEISYVVKKSGISILIVGADFADAIEKIKDELETVKHYLLIDRKTPKGWLNYFDFYSSLSTKEPEIAVDEKDPFLILFTSGTTGVPKGAVISQRSYFLIAGMWCYQLNLRENDIYMNVYPLFHMGGGPLSIIPTFYAGATLVIISTPPTPEKILSAIQKYKVTHFMAVPTLWRRILEYPDFGKYDLSSLKLAMGASDAMPKDLLEEVMNRVKVASPQLYGLSEGGLATYLSPEDSIRKIGSSGKPHIEVEVKIVDDNGREVKKGEVGEIILKSDHIMSFYWDMPEETQKAIKDGWLYTGDLGRFDQEGYLYVVGRKKDMIISGGQNIYPAEIEKLLLKHPKIEEAAIIGIPDREWNETVLAAIVLKKGESMTEEEVINYIKENMASYNKPRYVRFMEALPRTTATGKIQKQELKKRFLKEMGLE